jgi:hypothetical protein
MNIVILLIGFVCGYLCNERVWHNRISRTLQTIKEERQDAS